jgi:anti-sigma regulatory factor (Ser/Thr protein kinase)
MPYIECPGCRLRLYSAATRSWISDSCPVCDESLLGAAKSFPGQTGVRTMCREFPCTPRAAANARHALDGLYADLGEDLHATATLLISELVTNSVKHSAVVGGVIELVACVTPQSIRVEISDDGGGFDLEPVGHGDSEAGRGLELVQELADRWGRLTGLRTCVWFELDRVAVPLRSAPPLAPMEPAVAGLNQARSV